MNHPYVTGCYWNHDSALCRINWTYTPQGSQRHVHPLCIQGPLKPAGMTPALKAGLLPQRHAELGCETIINFYMSIFKHHTVAKMHMLYTHVLITGMLY